MLVSVIICTFNHERYINECIDSVYNQKYKNIEIILVDGDSEDNTLKIVNRDYPQIKKIIIVSEVKKLSKERISGEAIQKNRGLEFAQGEYIQFLDGDDLLEPEKIARQLPVLIEDNTLGYVYSDIEIIDETGNHISLQSKAYGVYRNNTVSFLDMINGDKALIHSILFPKRILKKIGCFNEEIIARNDWEFKLRIVRNYNVKYLPFIGGKYRKHSIQLTKNIDLMRISTSQIYEYVISCYNLTEDEKKIVYFCYGKAMYFFEEYEKAVKYFKKSGLFFGEKIEKLIFIFLSYLKIKPHIYRLMRDIVKK